MWTFRHSVYQTRENHHMAVPEYIRRVETDTADGIVYALERRSWTFETLPNCLMMETLLTEWLKNLGL